MLGIKGYRPNFSTSTSQFMDKHKSELRKIIGQRIECYYLQWETKENEWNEDGPIILRIGSNQYEFTAFQLDEYSLTVNKINLSEKLDWYGGGEEMPLIWKENPIDEVNLILNRKIEEIYLLEYTMIWNGNKNNEKKKIIGQLPDPIIFIVGIEFKLSGMENHLQLSNGLDCNMMKIETTKVDEKNRVVKLDI